MKKRDLILVALVLAFGVGYNSFKDGDIRFFSGGCSFDNRSLRDRDHPNSFQQQELRYANREIKEIEIDNAAGTILVVKSGDENILVEREIRVYHKKKERAREIEKEIDIKVTAPGEDGKLKLAVEPGDSFPYTRARVFFKVSIPETVKLDLWNRYGNVSIDGSGKDILVNGKYGDLSVKHVDTPVKLRHRHGKVNIRSVRGRVELSARHSRISINEVNALELDCAHSRVFVNGVEKETHIKKISYSRLKVENSDSLRTAGRHTKVEVKNIKNGVKLSNSHNSVTLEDITGDVSIKANHCRIRLARIDAGDIVIRNKYNHVRLEDIDTKNLDVLLSHGNLNVDIHSVKDRINIKNRHSTIRLSYPKSIHPGFNIDLNYGKIINHTPEQFTVITQRHRVRMNSMETGPGVVIDNTYGDVYLDNNRYVRSEGTQPTESIQKVETEKFEKLDETKKDNETKENTETKDSKKEDGETGDNS
ncbi:MAG: DUF4097 domain-containing protein [bacterium]|nr:DUF4097 domain-containing protein [bacterium]